MEFKIKKVSAMVLATSVVFGGSAMAAYGPAPAPAVSSNNWMLSAGYGQTFGHKKEDVDREDVRRAIDTVIKEYMKSAATNEQKNEAKSEAAKVMGALSTSKVDYPLQLKDLKILEVDLFHSSGFGLVYMGTADDKGMLQYGGIDLAKYEFSGIFGAYKMNFGQNMSLRGAVGQTTQKYNWGFAGTSKLDGEMAWNVEGKYHFKLGDSLAAFGAVGYLHQKELEEFNKYDPCSGYWKVGLSMSM